MSVLVKNGIVNMDWEKENFYESKEYGFVAAVQHYESNVGDLVVVFKNSLAFVIVDDEGNPYTQKDIENLLSTAINKDGQDADFSVDMYVGEENYVEFCNGGIEDEDLLEAWGISEDDKEAIIARTLDIGQYYSVEYQDM